MSTNSPVSCRSRIGLSAPQGIFSEFAGQHPREYIGTVRGFAERAEQLGFGSLWVSDHLLPVRSIDRGGVLEGWTLISVLSQLTTTVRLGQLVLCSAFRNPALVAKMAATLDVLSGGRLILGLGSGWFEDEFTANGYQFLSARERRAQLRDSVEIIRRLWDGNDSTYEGSHYSINGARSEPAPLQASPPVLIGGMGDRTLELVSRYADMANFHGSPEAFADANAVLDRHCESAGRDPSTIARTWFTTGLHVGETESAVRRTTERWRDEGDVRFPRLQHAGTAPQIVEKLGPYLERGCSEMIVTLSTAPSLDELAQFGEGVLPALTNRSAAR